MASFTRLLAWRFMLKGTERGKFSAMTLFAWLAIGVGIGTMTSLLCVMYGLESSLRDNVLRAYPHILIRRLADAEPVDTKALTATLRQYPGVSRVLPYLETEMIAQSENRTLGVVVWGIPDGEWSRIEQGLQGGKIPSAESPLPQGVLGRELADHLDVDIGDRVSLISPLRRQGALGSVPQSHLVEISGLYESGHYEFDKQYLFLPLLDVKDFVGSANAYGGWQVWTESLDAADGVATDLKTVVPKGWEVQSWTEFNAALFHSLQLEQLAMFLILSFAVVIAVMNVAITLMMHVSHKRKNVGILRALGASADQIRKAFMWQGAFLGAVGMGLGTLLSLGMLYYIQTQYEFPDIYYQRAVPVEIRPVSIALVYAVCSVLVLLATLYPANRAAEMDPIEAIRE